MYAIFKLNSKQYIVKEGDKILVDHIQNTKSSKLFFHSVLGIMDSKENIIGTPYVLGYCVEADILKPYEKGAKIYVFKKKRRKGYQKKMGHRQLYTKISINKIRKINYFNIKK